MVSDEWPGTGRAKRTYTLRCRDAKSCVSATVNVLPSQKEGCRKKETQYFASLQGGGVGCHPRNKKLEAMIAHLYWA